MKVKRRIYNEKVEDGERPHYLGREQDASLSITPQLKSSLIIETNYKTLSPRYGLPAIYKIDEVKNYRKQVGHNYLNISTSRESNTIPFYSEKHTSPQASSDVQFTRMLNTLILSKRNIAAAGPLSVPRSSANEQSQNLGSIRVRSNKKIKSFAVSQTSRMISNSNKLPIEGQRDKNFLPKVANQKMID